MLLTAPLHHCWTFIHQRNIVRSWGLSSLPSHSSFLSFLLFLIVTLFFLAFLVWVSKQNVSRKTQGTKFKMTSTFFTPTHFLLLTKRFFLTNYYLTKVIKGRTNQRGLSATSLPFTILFFLTTQKSYYGFLFIFYWVVKWARH